MPADRPPGKKGLRLIVGIDYGTTYSGLSFALSNAADFKDIHPWTKYPGSSSHASEHCAKAPSWVAFARENPDDLDSNAWGYQVEPGMNVCAWTKLLLDNSALTSEYDEPGLRDATGYGLMRLPAGMTPQSVVTEYLRGMNAMFVDAVEEKLGKLEDMPVDFWLTVPATWTEQAKLRTRAAALDAGFASRSIDSLSLIPEPEAAAHMALKSSFGRVENYVQCGSGIMVCDCGGGTVDITTYEVQATSPTLKLRELCVGVGGKCGGTFVDRNLHKLMKARFGETFTSLGAEHIAPGSKFMDDFEGKKRDFSTNSPNKRPARLFLPMPTPLEGQFSSQHYDKRFSSVLLTPEDMAFLFDPVIDKVIRLVTDQVNQVKRSHMPAIKTIALVGGFGSSPYLKERLQEWAAKLNIQLTTPLSGWSAVVCGAVLRGLEGCMVTEKKCRRHYGIAISHAFNPDVSGHRKFDRSRRYTWYRRFDQATYLSGFMNWGVNKGAIIDEAAHFKTGFVQTGTRESLRQNFEVDLLACSLDIAPGTIENERIEKVGTIQYRLDPRSMNWDRCESKRVGSEVVYKVAFDIDIRLGDEAGLLAFRIIHEGKEIGKAQLDFSYT